MTILEILGLRNLVVWLVLMGVTLVSWALSFHPAGQVSPSVSGGVVMIALAFIKVRLVIFNFMEVDHAPLLLRLICEAWGIIGCASVIGFYTGLLG